MPPHFAFLRREDTNSKLVGRLRKAGVRPILYARHAELPGLLGHVYQARLDKPENVPVEDGRRGRKSLTPRQYWKHLLTVKP